MNSRQPPSFCRSEIEAILISKSRLQSRVRELALEINDSLPQTPLLFVAVLKGPWIFASDLLRHLPRTDVELDFVQTASYGSSTEAGPLQWILSPRKHLRGRHVVLIDDILDSGNTLAQVHSAVRAQRPASLQTCVLLHKLRPRTLPRLPRIDFTGFEIPDRFVVGYGLDYAERFRNLPFIGVLRPPDKPAARPTSATSRRRPAPSRPARTRNSRQ